MYNNKTVKVGFLNLAKKETKKQKKSAELMRSFTFSINLTTTHVQRLSKLSKSAEYFA